MHSWLKHIRENKAHFDDEQVDMLMQHVGEDIGRALFFLACSQRVYRDLHVKNIVIRTADAGGDEDTALVTCAALIDFVKARKALQPWLHAQSVG